MTILDPLEATNQIEQRYRGYLRSTFRAQDQALADEFDHALGHDFTLTRGPYLEASAPFESGASIDDLVGDGTLSTGFGRLGEAAFPTGRPLYQHQEEAIRKAVRGRNLVVSTGTGSGKTECFLIPIIDALLREQENGTLAEPGVRALLLYPMNALANDQVKRLRTLLADLPELTFGRYVGETKRKPGDAEEYFAARHPGERRLPNELISRQQMQDTPPHILLTNYAMLEYLLLRPEDSTLFDGPTGDHWRFVVLDEAHVYGGAQGTEVAMLLRRVKDRVIQSEPGRLQCFATSATLGGGRHDHPRLVEFARNLFGEPFECEPSPHHDVVIAARRPLGAEDATHEITPAGIEDLQRAFRAGDSAEVAQLAAKHGWPPAPTDGPLAPWLHDLLRTEHHVIRLQRLLSQRSVDLGRAADRVFDRTPSRSALVALVDLCVAARPRPDDAPLLPARYHYFLRSLESGYVCHHPNHPPDQPRLLLSRHTDCPSCRGVDVTSRMFEIGVCRSCRVEYLVGRRDGSKEPVRFEPALPHLGAAEYLLLRPPVDDDEDQSAGDVEGTSWPANVHEMALCTSCGSIGETTACDCAGSFSKVVYLVSTKRGEVLRTCPVCASRAPGEIVMRLVTGTDAPASVIATDLYQATPPSIDPRLRSRVGQGRKLLMFSDSRQDAAFFAAFLDRTYGRAVERRVLYEAVLQLSRDEVPRAEDVLRRAKGLAEEAWLLDPDHSALTNRREVGYWILQELLALDRRQSMEGTGVAEISIAVPRLWEPPRALVHLGLGDEALDLIQLLLDTIRSSGAVIPPEDVDLRDARFEPRNRPIYLHEKGSAPGLLSWLPASEYSTNRRVEIVSKFLDAKELAGDPIEILRGIWRHLTEPNGPWGTALVAETEARHGAVWRLNWERFEFRLVSADHRPGRCASCRRLFWRSAAGRCPGWRCDGMVRPVDDIDLLRGDHYASLFTSLKMQAMEVQEHTAQWTAPHASKVQDEFVDGRVNALSCSTTFELGVDVGEVQAVFLRNMPPSAANYVQRAGRAGRRADSAALVVTFAQRRSHDLTHFDDPSRMVDGAVDPPIINLDNATIVRRHVHSVAFAAFEREQAARGIHHSTVAGFFLPQDGSQPSDLAWIEWMGNHPDGVREALERLVPSTTKNALGITSWDWVDALISEREGEPMFGWLTRAGEQARSEIQRLDDLFEEAREAGQGGLMSRYERIKRTQEERYLLSYLAARNVLPKYGFPVDVVDLNVAGSGDREAAGLDLSRDLRLAIAEYAPGAQVVAAKALWEATGLGTKAGHGLPTYWWGRCSDCGAYRHDLERIETCEMCGSPKVSSTGTVVIPVFGFVGKKAGRPGDTRPPRGARMENFFGSYVDDPGEFHRLSNLAGNVGVSYRVSRQGRINIVNMGPKANGYLICDWCGYGAQPSARGGSKPADHPDARRPGHTCKGTLHRRHLGHEFLTDVVELHIGRTLTNVEALSTLYALIEGAGAISISSGDIDGALHTISNQGAAALVIYDTVPGGAGHAQRICEGLEQVIRAALARVETCANCGPETSCYTCLRSYRNQIHHDELSRGAAIVVLRALVESDPTKRLERDLKLVDDTVRPIMRRLIERGAPSPEIGYELPDGTVVELAWPDVRIGVTVAPHAAPDGWDLRQVEDWSVDELLGSIRA